MKSILKSLSFLALASSLAWAAEPLLLQWGTIDTSSHAARTECAVLKVKVARKAALDRLRRAAPARAAYIVQFPGPVTEEWRTWLESSTQVRGYLPEFAYLVWATASEMETIAANPDVFWTGEWKKDYKTVCAGSASPAKTTASATADEARWMQVGSLLTGDDGAADLRARLEALPADVRSAFPRLDGSSAVAFLTDTQIDEVASWPDVEWIEPKLKARLFNDKAALTNMMNVTNAWKALSSGGLDLTGAGQIVAVADTGCDKGSKTDTHADFSGRILAGYGWTGGVYKASASWADIDAHGTHVCGSILGSGAKSSGQFRGMAYEAQLVMQGMWEDLGGLPDYTGDMLKQAYTNGARIHSDSWGFGTNYAGAYVYDSVYSDGYMWTNQNFIMVIAAGNDGIDKNSDGVIDATSVSAPGTAKNCICVGASENYRSSGGYSTYGWGSAWPDDYPAAPIKSDKISQTTTPQGLAAFSGRGPTKDGRFKPDIVAPGTDVISVRSRMAQDDGWGVYSSNTNYIYEGGTSMATPLTAGAVTLIRQWLVDRKGIAEPSAALMKALLINGARDMTPGQYGTGSYQEITARPDKSQGFGHVNLYNSLEPGAGNFLVFATNTLTSSANFTTNINVGEANAGKYVLTLVWQDYPGSSGGSKNLVNDLDLTVTSPSGTVYYPNNRSGLDHTNNVEFIEFTAAETGTYSVKVNGYSVSKTSPHGGQPFALVMRGPETISPEECALEFSSATSFTNGVQYGEIEFTFSDLLTQGYPAPVYHLATDVSEDEYQYDDANGYLFYMPQSYGTFTFQCVASNGLGTATNTLTVTVTQAPPAVPVNLALSDIGTSSFTASWDAAANADSYRLDVVQGDSFEAAAGEPVLEADFSSTSGWTLSGTGTYTSSGYYGQGSPSIKFDGTGDYAISPDFGSGVKLQFWALGNGGAGSTFAISGLVGGSWTDIETVTIAQGGDTYEVALPSGTSQVRFDFAKSVNCALDDVVVYGPGAEAGEYVPGWSNATVNATSANVTGLQPSTTYAVRVRAVNGGGTSANSAVATATTLAGLSAPVWAAFPTTVVDVGTNCWLDIASYASGSPAPTVTLVSSTADSGDYDFDEGYLMFAPPAGGNYTFTFAASNSAGTSNATLTVTGNVEAPVLATIGNRSGTVGEYVQFPLSATGIPAPAFDVSSTDAEDVVVMEQTGTFYFLFTPTNSGTYHFTVTATNIAGTASESFTVTVNAAPVTVPTLAVTNIAATSALATWTACDNVSTYTLQLASDGQFTTGGSGGTATLFSNDGTDATVPTDWSYEIESAGVKSGLVLKNDDYVITESFDASSCTALSLSLEIRTYGGSSGTTDTLLVQYSADDGTSWNNVGTVTATGKTLAAADPIDVSVAAGNAAVRLRFTDPGASSSQGVGIAYLVLTGTESASGGSLIAAETVGTTSYTFSALAPETTYYTRVKGTSDWSSVVSFTTQSAGDSTPVWSASFPSTATTNVGDLYELADLSSHVSGSPAPVITLTAPDGVMAEINNGDFQFLPESSGDYTFTFTASNSVGTATATLVVTAVGQAPVLSASQGTSLAVTVGTPVNFTVTATGIPAPTVEMAATEYAATFVNGAFSFTPDAVGTYAFTFTASNVEGTDTLTVTVTASAAPVTVPTLTVTNVTDTTALATWTACDGVTEYTLQLSTNDFPAASGSARSATPILSEDFVGFTPTSTTDIGSNNTLSNYTATSGWTGFKVYPENETAKIGASSGQGWLMTPALDASGTLTVVWSAYRYGTSDKNTILLGISENGTDFDEETITIGDEMAGYTNTFTVTGPTVHVRWMASGSSKARFYLDNVLITNPGGDTPTGDDIQEFTVAGTSHTFTNLTPYTVYYARVKGNADWSNVEEFITEDTGIAPVFSSGTAATNVVLGDTLYFDFEELLSTAGNPTPIFTIAPDPDEVADGTMTFTPSDAGTYTFTCTASNFVGTASCVLTVTVTGSAPVWQALPAQTIAVGEYCELYLTSYVSGTPAPSIALTTGGDIAGFDPDEDNYFLFTTPTAGTYTFVFTASNVLGTATADLTVTVTGGDTPASDYEQWLIDNNYPEEPEGTIAENGRTYYENYIADIDPTSTNLLEVSFSATNSSMLTIDNMSTNRYYQFIYYTNLLSAPITNYLGQGVEGKTLDYPVDDTFFGRIRVLLDEP